MITAAIALGKIGDNRAVEPLILALKDRYSVLQDEAVAELAAVVLGDPLEDLGDDLAADGVHIPADKPLYQKARKYRPRLLQSAEPLVYQRGTRITLRPYIVKAIDDGLGRD